MKAVAIGAVLALGLAGPALAQDKTVQDKAAQEQGTQAQQPGLAPKHERSATEDMTRAVPPMTPDQKQAAGSSTAGGWTADGTLRETGKKDAVENTPGASGSSGSSSGGATGAGSSSGAAR